MHFINELYQFVANQPAGTWHAIGAFLGGSTLVASLLQVVKHKFSVAEAKKLVALLLGCFSFLAATADFLLQYNANHPLPNVGKLTVELIGGATLVHRFVVSPSYYKLAAKLEKFVAVWSQLSNLEKQAAPTAQADEANLSQFQVEG